MPDTKESFEILEDASGGGVSCSKSEAGESSTGKIGPTVFAFRDSSGNLVLPQLDSLGRVPASLRSDGSPGASAPSIANLVGGSDGSNLRSILVDSTGRPIVTTQDALYSAYSATSQLFSVAANPTDIWRIIGSASRTIRIKSIRVSGTTTSGSPIRATVSLLKRSTANTGGTAVAADAVPHDSTNPAASAAANHYTANPTLGTLVGAVRSRQLSFNNTGMQPEVIAWEFGQDSQPLILRGVAQSVCVNLNGRSITGSVMSIDVEWVEV